MPAVEGSRHAGQWWAHPRHGPLPGLLLLLTVGTGLIDAVSILGLGRVFVANMTGNVVFIGFGLAGAPGFSIAGSLVALVAFLVGAAAGGGVIARTATHRGRLLRNTTALQVGLVAVAGVVALVAGSRPALPAQLAILALAAVGLGLQNAAVRRLAVPDLTTTVLTMTLTGIGADIRKRDWVTLTRRAAAVGAMLVGAVIGALLVLHWHVVAGLAASLLVLAAVFVIAAVTSRHPAPWQIPA